MLLSVVLFADPRQPKAKFKLVSHGQTIEVPSASRRARQKETAPDASRSVR